FDCEILPGGIPGPPVPTLVTLTKSDEAEKLFKANRAAFIYDRAALADGLKLLREEVKPQAPLPDDLRDSGNAVIAALDDLGAEAKDETPTYQRDAQAAGFTVVKSKFSTRAATAGETGYDRFKAYRSSLERSLIVIQSASQEDSFKLAGGAGEATTIDPS